MRPDSWLNNKGLCIRMVSWFLLYQGDRVTHNFWTAWFVAVGCQLPLATTETNYCGWNWKQALYCIRLSWVCTTTFTLIYSGVHKVGTPSKFANNIIFVYNKYTTYFVKYATEQSHTEMRLHRDWLKVSHFCAPKQYFQNLLSKRCLPWSETAAITREIVLSIILYYNSIIFWHRLLSCKISGSFQNLYNFERVFLLIILVYLWSNPLIWNSRDSVKLSSI